MIYEIRTYTLHPQATPEVERRFGAAYAVREKYSKLAGFFHTEIGPLNEVIHIWPYESLEERARIRAEAAKDPGWPPDINEFVTSQRVEIVVPWDFAPAWEPGKDGPYYEFRQYTVRPGSLPAIMKNWSEKLPERLKLSKTVLMGSVEFGPNVNSFIHVWPYQSLEQRGEVRARAIAEGIWPPPGGREYFLTQSTKILLPASFSPAQ